MMERDGIWLHAGSRLWLGSISDPAKRSPRGGIASPTQCLSRKRQGWVSPGEGRDGPSTAAALSMCWGFASARPNLRRSNAGCGMGSDPQGLTPAPRVKSSSPLHGALLVVLVLAVLDDGGNGLEVEVA